VSAGQKILKTGWRAVVGLLLLTWIFHSIFRNEGRLVWQHQGRVWENLSAWQQAGVAWTYGPAELWRTLCLIPVAVFILSLLFMGATIFLGVQRWRLVLRVPGLELPLSRTIGISFVAHFFNSFLLGSTGGDLIKAYYAARETHHKKTEAVTTVLVDRLIGLWAMLLFAGIMMLPNLEVLLRYRRLTVLCGVILAMLAGTSIILGVAFWGGISSRFPNARSYLRRLPKGAVLERALEACREYGRGKRFLGKTLALSMLLNLACVLQLMVLAHGLGLRVPALLLSVIVPMIICISALPITPSGLGVRENLFVYMLAVPEAGVPATTALSLSLLAYAGSLVWSLIGGVVYFCLRDKEHLTEVTHDEAVEEKM
jgi:uncharacterized protein (TIRG00374 family)